VDAAANNKSSSFSLESKFQLLFIYFLKLKFILLAVYGGPVSDEFNFLQFHMHWGDNLDRGSEHLIDGKPYAGELHFVNWNHKLYSSPEKASNSNKNDGLLVLAKFVKVSLLGLSDRN